MPFLNNIINSNSGRRQGASTLTQQYVNNLIVDSAVARGEDATATLNGNKTYAAKIREMKLAISMEQNKSKDEILEGYLNIVNLGGSNYGVEAAAQYYWGISAKDLNVGTVRASCRSGAGTERVRPDREPRTGP